MEINKLPKRRLVKTESPIEAQLVKELLNFGLHPVTGYKIGPYRADIAFPEKLLVIECDGKDYHTSEEQKEHDRVRDEYMTNIGWTVVRFTGSEIYKMAPAIAKMLAGKKFRELPRLNTLYKINPDEMPEIIQEKREINYRLTMENEDITSKSQNEMASIGSLLKNRLGFINHKITIEPPKQFNKIIS